MPVHKNPCCFDLNVITLYLVCGVCMPSCVWRSADNLNLFTSATFWDPGDWTLVVGLGGKHFYSQLLSHPCPSLLLPCFHHIALTVASWVSHSTVGPLGGTLGIDFSPITCPSAGYGGTYCSIILALSLLRPAWAASSDPASNKQN